MLIIKEYELILECHIGKRIIAEKDGSAIEGDQYSRKTAKQLCWSR